MTKVNELLSEREKTHGDFRNVAEISQILKSVLRESEKWEGLTYIQQEALDMMCSKMGRLLSGDPRYHDHSDDIVGYAVLLRRALDD